MIATDVIFPEQSTNSILARLATVAVAKESALLNSAEGEPKSKVSVRLPSHFILTVPEKSEPVTYTV